MTLLEKIMKREKELSQLWTEVARKLEFVLNKFGKELQVYKPEFIVGPHEHSYFTVMSGDERATTFNDMGIVIRFENNHARTYLKYQVLFRIESDDHGKKGDLLLEQLPESDIPISYKFKDCLEQLNIEDLELPNDSLELKMYSIIKEIN